MVFIHVLYLPGYQLPNLLSYQFPQYVLGRSPIAITMVIVLEYNITTCIQNESGRVHSFIGSIPA